MKKAEQESIEMQDQMKAQEEWRRLQRCAEKMEPWRDSDQPEAYLTKFEKKQIFPRRNGLADSCPC